MPKKPLKARNRKPDFEPCMIEYLKNGHVDESNYTRKEYEIIEWEVLDWDVGPFRGARPLIRPHEAWEILKARVNPKDYPYAYERFEKGESKKKERGLRN